jgi:hypothetical protein
MPYDPNYPPLNAPLQSAPMRDQFQGLKTLIDGKPDTADTASNPNGQFGNFDPNWEPQDPPSADDCRWLRDRIWELYLITRRT